MSSLNVGSNQINILNITGCINLEQLSCSFNKLTTLDLSTLVKLNEVSCIGNLFTQLDFSHQPLLQFLECDDNALLTKINIQNDSVLSDFLFSGNQALELICCDANETGNVQNMANFYGYTNVSVSSTCDLVLRINEDLKSNENQINFNNPCSDEVILNSDEKLKNIELYDGNGRLILKSKETKLNTSSLPKGIYFIKITTASNKTISKRGIKY